MIKLVQVGALVFLKHEDIELLFTVDEIEEAKRRIKELDKK